MPDDPDHDAAVPAQPEAEGLADDPEMGLALAQPEAEPSAEPEAEAQPEGEPLAEAHPWAEPGRPRGLDAYFPPGGEDLAPPERVADERRLTRLLVIMLVLLIGIPLVLTVITLVIDLAALGAR